MPDPELHDTTIAEALRQGRPILVQFATPVYCESQFCGPTVEAQEALAAEYGDVAEFIHVEIWRDFDQSVVNRAAADWLLRGESLTEPWMYLIGSDGVIVERWGPLFDPTTSAPPSTASEGDPVSEADNARAAGLLPADP